MVQPLWKIGRTTDERTNRLADGIGVSITTIDFKTIGFFFFGLWCSARVAKTNLIILSLLLLSSLDGRN